MKHTLLILIAALTGPLLGQEDTQKVDARGMWAEVLWGDDGELLLSVEARDVTVEDLMDLVAERLRIGKVEGFENIEGNPRLTVHVVQRPATQALRWILGSVGIVAVVGDNSITVEPDVGINPDAKALLRKAGARYFDSLRNYPSYPMADRAQMARASIAERLGQDQWAAAALAYDELIEEYPRSEFVPEARLRSARLYGKLGTWEQAILRYTDLLPGDDAHAYSVIGRTEQAAALCSYGEAQEETAVASALGLQALGMLEALWQKAPTQDPSERYERLLIRGRAEALSGDAISALQALDAATRYSNKGEADARILELRARALARAGEFSAASSAWLALAESVQGPEKGDAYQSAAEAALEGGEELAVLMIHARAAELGFGDRLAASDATARARLGLGVTSTTKLSPSAELARGKAHATARRWEAAREVLRSTYRNRDQLNPEEQVQLAQAYARTLHRLGHEEAAIDVVRAITRGLKSEGRRRHLYLLAADLYEDRSSPRFDLAIEALKGRL